MVRRNFNDIAVRRSSDTPSEAVAVGTDKPEADRTASHEPRAITSLPIYKRPFRRAWRVIGIIVFISMIGLAGFWYSQAHYYQNNPAAASAKQTASLLQKVAQLTELPTNEQPSVQTVADAKALQSSTFYKNSQNGDKVIVYSKANKAILYRPSTDKIVNVGGAFIASGTLSIVIVDAANDHSRAQKVADQIAARYNNVTLAATIIPAPKTVKGTTVVAQNKVPTATVTQLASDIEAKTGTVPSGLQTVQDVDIVIYVGTP